MSDCKQEGFDSSEQDNQNRKSKRAEMPIYQPRLRRQFVSDDISQVTTRDSEKVSISREKMINKIQDTTFETDKLQMSQRAPTKKDISPQKTGQGNITVGSRVFLNSNYSDSNLRSRPVEKIKHDEAWSKVPAVKSEDTDGNHKSGHRNVQEAKRFSCQEDSDQSNSLSQSVGVSDSKTFVNQRQVVKGKRGQARAIYEPPRAGNRQGGGRMGLENVEQMVEKKEIQKINDGSQLLEKVSSLSLDEKQVDQQKQSLDGQCSAVGVSERMEEKSYRGSRDRQNQLGRGGKRDRKNVRYNELNVNKPEQKTYDGKFSITEQSKAVKINEQKKFPVKSMELNETDAFCTESFTGTKGTEYYGSQISRRSTGNKPLDFRSGETRTANHQKQEYPLGHGTRPNPNHREQQQVSWSGKGNKNKPNQDNRIARARSNQNNPDSSYRDSQHKHIPSTREKLSHEQVDTKKKEIKGENSLVAEQPSVRKKENKLGNLQAMSEGVEQLMKQEFNEGSRRNFGGQERKSWSKEEDACESIKLTSGKNVAASDGDMKDMGNVKEKKTMMLEYTAGDDWNDQIEKDDWGWDNPPSDPSSAEKKGSRYNERSHSPPERKDQNVTISKHRGGLIQLSGGTGSGEDLSSAVGYSVPSQFTGRSGVQKHLYDPNNPQKPMLVVASSRDSTGEQKQQLKGCNLDKEFPALCHTSSDVKTDSAPPNEAPHSPNPDPTLLYSIQKGEMDIQYYISSNQLPREFSRIMDIRAHLRQCYRQLLLCDIRYCENKNIEASLWRTLYHLIIEKLREYISRDQAMCDQALRDPALSNDPTWRDPSLRERSLPILEMVITEGLQYFQELLVLLQRTYHFTLEEHLDGELTVQRSSIRCALLSSQKILLSLGDLARYQQQFEASPNYFSAKKWYELSLQVYPRNGRPFNQLAIVALAQKRPLDVVYYYMRSLTAANPFICARDSLIGMFEDIRRKYESTHQKNKVGDVAPLPPSPRRGGWGGARKETWVRPDSGHIHCRLSRSNGNGDARLEEIKKMPLEQVMKLFLAGFLHCHGMLFSRVGLDMFRDICCDVLRLFSVLLRGSPPRLNTQHLLQVMAINMFAIDNTQHKEQTVGNTYRSSAQEMALILSQEMFGCLCAVGVELLPQSLQMSPQIKPSAQGEATPPVDPFRLFSPVVAGILPAIKVWCDYLLYNSNIWNPPPSSQEFVPTNWPDTWNIVAELSTLLRGLGPPDVPLGEGGGGVKVVGVKLGEDLFLRGYDAVSDAHKKFFVTQSGVHLGRAIDWLRLQNIQTCLCQFLCGVDPPILRLQKSDIGDVFISLVDNNVPVEVNEARLSMSISENSPNEEDSCSSGLESSSEEEEQGGQLTAVKLLAKRKRILEKQQRRQSKLQSRMMDVTVEMEIQPRYLIPDTNCFIENLHLIRSLLQMSPYTIMVPLVGRLLQFGYGNVLNELEGLSRGASVAKYGSVNHAVKVKESAAFAFHFLRTGEHKSLKCVTSQGSVLTSTAFTAELDVEDTTNDDKILSCCLHFFGSSHQKRSITAGVRNLYREVVLLTEDRNLRVKAYARDVPVMDVRDFARWAGVKKTNDDV